MVVLVTGSNRGIGLEIVRKLAHEGHTIYAGVRNLKEYISKFKPLREESGNYAIFPIELDITNPNHILEVSKTIQKESKALDILINNAGVLLNSDDIEELKMEDVRITMETNFFGPLQLAKALIPLLKESSDGRIINVSSGMGALSEMSIGYAAYRLSKTAINGLTNVLAADLRPYSIQAYSVCPGWVQTDMGGQGAPRSVSEGADSILSMISGDYETGRFYRDGKMIHW